MRKPQTPNAACQLHSLSKSFTSTAVGLAIADGKLSLDDEVLKFYPDLAPRGTLEKLAGYAIVHLLTMSSGQQTEAKFTKDMPWVQTFLAQPVPFKPGTHFLYNTPGPTCCRRSCRR